MPKVVLDKIQKEVLDYEGDMLLCFGRRSGKTFILARKAIEAMVNKNKNVIVVSLTEDQAELIIQFALAYAEEKYPKLIGKGRKKPQLKKIWVGRSHLMARPVGATGNSVRGFEGGILIVDEASRMPAHFWASATPVILMTGGNIWLASTPAGKTGYFWERFNESYNLKSEEARFKVFYTTTPDVIKNREFSTSWTPELKEKVIKNMEMEKKTMSELEFGQEYLGLFMEDIMQFFPDEMIKACQTLKRPEVLTPANYYLGVDIARLGSDESVFSVLKMKDSGKLYQVESLVTEKTRLTDTTKLITGLDSRFDFQKIFLDSGGIGVGVLDMLLDQDQTKRKVEGIDNSKRTVDAYGKEKGILKTDLYWNLRYLMENKLIYLLDDHNIFMSLKMIQYEEGVDNQGKKVTRIFGPKGKAGDHIAESLIRAAWASKQKINKLWIHSFSI